MCRKKLRCHALLLPGCTGCASKNNPLEKIYIFSIAAIFFTKLTDFAAEDLSQLN